MNNFNKVLIVDDMHESIIPLLKEAGYDPIYLPVITRNEILEIIHEFVGLVIRSKTMVDPELIEKGKYLKFVARAGSGIDKLDVSHLKSRDITIINAPEGNRDALGEHVLGILLTVLHRLHISFQQVSNGMWDREGNRGIELKGKVVGIFGVGHMGTSFARKLAGMECEVIGYDKYVTSFDSQYVKKVSIDEFFERTEILSIHIPLTEETRYLFDGQFLSNFSRLKVLINTSRGKILKLEDLVHLLEDGRLYGAALDVLENEKLAIYTNKERSLIKKLISFPNVIITPHVGGWTFESYQRINEVLVEKLKMAFQ